MPTVRESVLEFLHNHPDGIDDDALTQALGLSRRQHTNAVCRILAAEGLITRSIVEGKIHNFFSGSVDPHECDLFLLSSHRAYFATNALPQFAWQGARNLDGWGIGCYVEGQAHVIRSSNAALQRGGISQEFSTAVQTIASPITLGHLRLASTGQVCEENSHPFQLNFLGYDWLLIHNGHSPRAESLVSYHERLLFESTNDSPRVFEYLRQQIITYFRANPRRSLIEAVRSAYNQLLEADPRGKFNLILSNGHLVFALIHWRPFYLLHREKASGDAVLLSTLPLTEEEEWIEFAPSRGKLAKMLVFNGPTLILNGDIPK